MTWVTVPVSVVAAILVSPLLAGWTVGLTTDPASARAPWWRPRSVSARRLITVAAVAAVLAAGAAGGDPLVAWWLFAAGGAVLCVVDVRAPPAARPAGLSAGRRRSGCSCGYRGR